MEALLNPEVIIKKCDFFVGAKVADFGCGHGHLSLLIAKEIGNEGKLYAFDILDEALEGIENKASALNLRNIEIKKTNLALNESTGLRKNSVDFVLAANMMFQNPDDDKFNILKEAFRILKQNGKLIVIDWSLHGSLGPKNHKVDIEKIKNMALSIGFKINDIFNVGLSHWGIIFIK
jgi:ubiquinone/menaquinone biosynthesis C-methylase UbiE